MRGTAIVREPASTERPIISSTLLSTGKLFTVSSETPAEEHIEKPPQIESSTMRGTAIVREPASTERPIISSTLLSTGKLFTVSSETPAEEHIEKPPQIESSTMRGTAIVREPASTERPIISSTLLSTGKLFTVSSETPAEEHIEKPPQIESSTMRGTAIVREPASTERPIISSTLLSTGKLFTVSSETPAEEHIEKPPQIESSTMRGTAIVREPASTERPIISSTLLSTGKLFTVSSETPAEEHIEKPPQIESSTMRGTAIVREPASTERPIISSTLLSTGKLFTVSSETPAEEHIEKPPQIESSTMRGTAIVREPASTERPIISSTLLSTGKLFTVSSETPAEEHIEKPPQIESSTMRGTAIVREPASTERPIISSTLLSTGKLFTVSSETPAEEHIEKPPQIESSTMRGTAIVREPASTERPIISSTLLSTGKLFTVSSETPAEEHIEKPPQIESSTMRGTAIVREPASTERPIISSTLLSTGKLFTVSSETPAEEHIEKPPQIESSTMRGTAIVREPASTERPIISSTLLSTGKLFTVSSETPAEEHIEKPPQFVLPCGVPCYLLTLVHPMHFSVGIRFCSVLFCNTEIRCKPAVVCSSLPSTSNPAALSSFQSFIEIRICRNPPRLNFPKSSNQTAFGTMSNLPVTNRIREHESPNDHRLRGTSLRKVPSFDTVSKILC
ncbi:unnamed protein product [Calicophoron daubneyi]|uniref:Uncharacterized protein n=1 Tax=Calicophoron daubneyi TaxID=300641 RepID=A0AAV2T2B7_CALDB